MTNFDQLLDVIRTKSLQDKKTWYSAVAAAYDKTRPRYPQSLIDRAIALAHIPAHARILEVGCGPGIATVAFAQQGFAVTGVEPSAASCELARQNCAPYAAVEIINTTFEEWELQPAAFDAVLAATSLHWVSPETGYPKAANALKPEGCLILLWNTPPQPSFEVYQTLQPIYQQFAPRLAYYEDHEIHRENLKKLGQKVIDSGYFHALDSEQLVCEVTYPIEDYLALLSTLSPYIMLDAEQRNSLFVALRERLRQDYGDRIPLSYLSALQVLRKVVLDSERVS